MELENSVVLEIGPIPVKIFEADENRYTTIIAAEVGDLFYGSKETVKAVGFCTLEYR